MAASKPAKKEKKQESTAEFVARVNQVESKRNGLKLRFGFTKRTR
jgi:hypothetical protein